MQLGVNDLDAGQAGARFHVDRDTTSAVVDLDAAIGVQDDVDLGPVARDRLVDRVVDDLPHAVHEAGRPVRPDVHPGPLADGFEAFKHLEMMGGVLGIHNLRV